MSVTRLLSNGKFLAIFGAMCMVLGIIFFPLYDHMLHTGFRNIITGWMMDHLGKYGFCGFFLGAGLVIMLRGLLMMRIQKQDSK